ncbi:MAG TPA: tetratricopeptide repeat protein, partial [Verrucomicrobiae bacterium]|nr:tetratricopeptide repeat protein [Verrucomicrobiae bacterium]
MILNRMTCRVVLAALLFFCLAGAAVAEEYEGLFREANDLSASGDLAGAVAVLSRVPAPKAGEEGEAFVRSRMQIARIGAAAGTPEKALEAAREVLALYPDNSEAKNFLAALEKQQMPRWKRFVHDA